MLKIIVVSGKGGVGKTTVACSLAYAFKELGKKVGILDLDLTGPNVVKALNVTIPLAIDVARVKYVPAEVDGIKVVSMAQILPDGVALLLKGYDSDESVYTRSSIIKEFAFNVDWGEGLDVLVVDMPPGTGDEVTSAIEYLAPDGAVVVTIPHSMAYEDYKRVVHMLELYNIRIFKTVVNLAYFDAPCPHYRCKAKFHRYYIFSDGQFDYYNKLELPIDPKVAETHRVDLKGLAEEILAKVVG
jgi:ATP-binding protein involved in chromosome partitioning